MRARRIESALPGVENVMFTVGLAAEMAGLETNDPAAKPAAPAKTALRVGRSDAGPCANPITSFSMTSIEEPIAGSLDDDLYGQETTSVSWLLRPSVKPRSFIQ